MTLDEVMAGDIAVLLEELGEALTVYPKLGNSSVGPTFGNYYSETAYVEPGYRVVVDAKGMEVVASLYTVHSGECSITAEDEALFAGKRYRAIAVNPSIAAGAVHQVEVHWKSVSR